RVPGAGARGGRHHARHDVHRALRAALPRRLLVRTLPHPHGEGGERVVSAALSAAVIAAALGQFPPTDEQTAVIEAPLEPALVVAGAGSGKTETMAARVVWLVANGVVRRDEVLGLTFTRKAAGELAERIQRRLRRLAEFEQRGLLPALPRLHAEGRLAVFFGLERERDAGGHAAAIDQR